MENIERRVCVFCNRTLKVVGYLRKNGKNHGDWNTRDLHKKCWKLKIKQCIDNHFENKLKEKYLDSI
jgi:hypothetical protein